MDEFNLSEKIRSVSRVEQEYGDAFIPLKDVKEFIRILKINLISKLEISMGYRRQFEAVIDDLAGDKLK